MFKKSEIWILLLLLLSGKAFSQTNGTGLRGEKRVKPIIQYHSASLFWKESNQKTLPVPPVNRNIFPAPILPQNHFHTQLGFICKKEWQVEKFTKMPLRLRLGSLQYTNYLEGK